MKAETYLKFFKTENAALDWMRTINKARKLAGTFYREMLVVSDGPEDNFAVMDLASAIELDCGYKWEA